MENLILNMPVEPAAKLNYMFALAACENYHIPTSPSLSVQEMISNRIYSWYKDMVTLRSEDEVSWYNNYE
jgi:hypothetical protein